MKDRLADLQEVREAGAALAVTAAAAEEEPRARPRVSAGPAPRRRNAGVDLVALRPFNLSVWLALGPFFNLSGSN